MEARILYVEDNPDNRLLVRRVLMAEGYLVFEAVDAAEGIALAQCEHLDLILLDMNLPEVDGYTLTGRLRSIPECCDVPIVAMTANVMHGDREKSLEAGCDGYIPKPIDVDLLPEQVAAYLHMEKRHEREI